MGIRTLDGNAIRLVNRTNDTTITLTNEQAARWRTYYLLKGKPVAERAQRITGFNRSRNKSNLFVGGVKADELQTLINIIKEAKTLGKGVTFFLWKNDASKYPDAPPLTMQAVVAQDAERGPAPASRSQQRRQTYQRPAPVAEAFDETENVVDELDL